MDGDSPLSRPVPQSPSVIPLAGGLAQFPLLVRVARAARPRRAPEIRAQSALTQPLHRELELAAGQLAPTFHRGHVSRRRPAIQERPRPSAGLVSRLSEALPRIAVIGLSLPAPGCHPIG